MVSLVLQEKGKDSDPTSSRQTSGHMVDVTGRALGSTNTEHSLRKKDGQEGIGSI